MAYDALDLPKATPDRDQVKKDVDEFGYGILTDLLSADEIARLRDRLEEQARLERAEGVAWLGNGGRGGNTWIGSEKNGEPAPWQAVRTLPNKGRPFIDLIMNPVILDFMSHIFRGREFYLMSSNGLIIRKGAMPMVVHTDQLFVPNQTPFPYVANIMVTLSDFTADMGATRVAPRSHLREAPKMEIDYDHMDAKNPDPIETVAAECPAGSAIVFEGRLWHTSGASTSDKVRYSISTYYGLPFLRQQDLIPASLHDAVYASLSEEEKAMLGFKTNGFGRLDPRFPGDRTNTDVLNPYIPELREGGSAHAVPVEGAKPVMPSSVRKK
ncbi:MAG TPA: phytanoyl-CoA dioxygenase family protein [Caulobacterales bacterium]|nr:phytanoyl-CoA dioxygenase family protein [Caulobacterales bacterium]